MLNWPVARLRRYGVLVHWASSRLARPLEQLTGVLGPRPAKHDGSQLFCSGGHEMTLSRGDRERTLQYDLLSNWTSAHCIVDLPQFPTHRPRHTLRDGSCPTFTRTCNKFWRETFQRFPHPEECLLAQGFPANPRICAMMNIHGIALESFSRAALYSFSGNTMHAACAGAITLWSLVFVKTLPGIQMAPTDSLPAANCCIAGVTSTPQIFAQIIPVLSSTIQTARQIVIRSTMSECMLSAAAKNASNSRQRKDMFGRAW